MNKRMLFHILVKDFVVLEIYDKCHWSFFSSVFSLSSCLLFSAMSSTDKDLSSPIFLLSNISNLVSTRLDSTILTQNFSLRQFSRPIRHKLLGFSDGSTTCLEKLVISSSFKTTTSSVNPLFEDWIA